ncbi:hypothetical protein, partial [Enterobacter hormaechei]|uniref:hypothetical protein n=1 Tax=Enterobacter hormaechei TaxID=158836 RepID=UPI0019545E49
QMMDVSAVEQRPDGGDQHHVIGPYQFPQNPLSYRPGCAANASHVNNFVALPQTFAVSIVIAEHSANSAKLETSVAVIVPFE